MIFIRVLCIVTTLIGIVGIGLFPILLLLWPVSRKAENIFRDAMMMDERKLRDDENPFIRPKNLLYWLLGTLAFIAVSRVCAMIAS